MTEKVESFTSHSYVFIHFFILIWHCKPTFKRGTQLRGFLSPEKIQACYYLSGLLTQNEKAVMDSVDSQYAKYWVPMQWTFSLLKMARDEQRIESDHVYIDLVDVSPFSLYTRRRCLFSSS